MSFHWLFLNDVFVWFLISPSSSVQVLYYPSLFVFHNFHSLFLTSFVWSKISLSSFYVRAISSLINLLNGFSSVINSLFSPGIAGYSSRVCMGLCCLTMPSAKPWDNWAWMGPDYSVDKLVLWSSFGSFSLSFRIVPGNTQHNVLEHGHMHWYIDKITQL